MEKPKDGGGANSGIESVSALGKESVGAGEIGNRHVKGCLPRPQSILQLRQALFRYHAQIVWARCLLQCSLHLHRGRRQQSENLSWSITNLSHLRSSIVLSRSSTAITHRPIHKIIVVCIRFPQMTGSTMQDYLAEISSVVSSSCRNFLYSSSANARDLGN